jgi:hypothetical protein
VRDRQYGAHACVILAQVATARHDAAAARAFLEEALPLYHEIGDGRSGAVALAHLGELAFCLGEGAAAGDDDSQALPIFLECLDSGMSALMLSGLAALTLAAGAVLPAVRLAAVASVVSIADWVAAERWADVPGPLQMRGSGPDDA